MPDDTHDEEHLQTVASLADAPEGQVVQAAVKRQRLIQTRYSLAKNDFLTAQEITELAQEITVFDKLIARIIKAANVILPEGALEKLIAGQVSLKSIHRLLAKDPKHKEARQSAFNAVFDRFNGVPVEQDGDLDLEVSNTALTQKGETATTATPDAAPTQKPEAAPDR